MSTKPQDSASSKTGQKSNAMASPSQSQRTMIFVVAAVGCLAVTGLFEAMNRPASIEEYGKMGQEFYPEFTDPTEATSLTVSVIDQDEVKPLEFSVKQASNGQWVIPSHHDYPADAADQLAKTASSIIGIKRGAMISRWESDHAKYGVVDPVTDSVSVDQLQGIGKRITIGGPNDTTLASYIVGKKYENSEDQYYVRHPNEGETYIAELDINLTTKFGDWVNTDLLDITSGDVLRLDLNDYSFDEIRGTITGNVQSVLARKTSSDDWALEGLDEETEQVKESSVTETLNTLANLEIVGVRPKQPGLTADLQIDRDALTSQRDLDRLSNDLLSRGFILQPNKENQELLELISREGEMFVGAQDGLLYRLYFGRAFTGSNEDLEIGMTSTDEEQEADENPDGSEEESEAAAPSGKPGRYVFVRVNFDPTLLGDVLTKPDEPTEPAEIKELQEKIAAAALAEETQETSTESNEAEPANPETAAEDKNDESNDAASADDETGEQAAEEESDEQKLSRLQQEFAAAQTAYQTALAAYEDYTKKIDDGKAKSEDLNRRFALWYYVIAGDSFDKLSLDRSNIVEPKSEEEEGADPGANTGLNIPPGLGGIGEAIRQNAGVNPAGIGNLAPPTPKAEPQAEPETEPAATEKEKSKEPSADEPAEAPEATTETPPAESPNQQAPPAEEPSAEEPSAEEPSAEEPSAVNESASEEANGEGAKPAASE